MHEETDDALSSEEKLAQTFGAALFANREYDHPAAASSHVQRAATTDASSREDPELIHAAGRLGIHGAGGSLPYLDQIRKAFGRHDVSKVVAHTDGSAAAGAQAMEAAAFTMGDHVAFAGDPSLHTAAHEAAHVVQQRAGVTLAGGVGQVGDIYEQHADAVAELVVRGQSSEALLDAGPAGAHAGGHREARTSRALQRQPAPQPDQQRAEVEAVTSEAIEEYEGRASSSFSDSQKRLARRVSQIDEILKRSKLDATKRETLAAMQTRWDDTILTDPAFDPIGGVVSAQTAADLRARLQADRVDAKKIKNAGLTDWINKLASSLSSYLRQHQQLDEETEQFHRFDDAFLTPEVIAALDDVGAGFRPADLKAMLAKESADFTNTRIAGLETKSAGITSQRANRGGYVGIAQMDTTALKAATARGKQIDIAAPARTKKHDPRTVPSEAILLAALYLSEVARQLRAQLPAPQPTGAELKKLVLAAYNTGAGAVARVVKQHLAAAKPPSAYTWDDIIADKAAMNTLLTISASKPQEVMDYVQHILDHAP